MRTMTSVVRKEVIQDGVGVPVQDRMKWGCQGVGRGMALGVRVSCHLLIWVMRRPMGNLMTGMGQMSQLV
jgi:hypothetical protein